MNAEFRLRPMTTTVNGDGHPVGTVCAVEIESLGDGTFACLANIHPAMEHALLDFLIKQISKSLHAQFEDIRRQLEGEDHGH